MSSQSIVEHNISDTKNNIDNFLIKEGIIFNNIIDYDIKKNVDYDNIRVLIELEDILCRRSNKDELLLIINKILKNVL